MELGNLNTISKRFTVAKVRIQLKQGGRTYVERGEFKSLAAVLDFYNSLSTAQVTEVWGFSSPYTDTTIPPVDDMAYFPMVKLIARNEESQKSMQVVVRNVKLTKDSTDIALKIKECMEIDGLNIDATIATVFKESKLSGY
ncbi:hypothetical protein Sulku_1340 [Sulfuricurvum kujiense DSM 16994]|uniref:Uncharacterized protein n=1 Tax=Sulfuricurvum kujiense (strain ATCC BAA-921 / DSM 16994 / JCM 11577 / YK-1) TaxID=709032 RepID=E4TY83_SULKY|nr:hypothetical protein [Sulfuricurvum kujiense]ADR34003.1 hypothetical protein Sulku_1340 [Sulfuricurvum kujiense DSM 16994]